jgi:hypothetical protein
VWRCALLLAVASGGLALGGCAQDLPLGSDVLWTARYEAADLSEWSTVSGGGFAAYPAPNVVEAANERAWRGSYSARFTIESPSDGSQANAGLTRSGFLPPRAYYSAWYYLPRTIAVGTFWVIFKFRMRTVADDASTSAELFDLNLDNTADGGMTLRLYDHRSGDVVLDVAAPTVPVGSWFQIEAFYSNPGVAGGGGAAATDAAATDAAANNDAANNNGRLTFWLDGRQVVDLAEPMAPTTWVGWDVVSVGKDLSPSTAVLFADDCAVSLTRVGPTGIIATPKN